MPVGWLVTKLRVKINPKRNAGLWAPSLSRAQPQTPDVTAAEPPGCPHFTPFEDVGLYGQYLYGTPRCGFAAPRFYVGNLLSDAEFCTSVPAHRCDEPGSLSTAAHTGSISRCPPGRAGSRFPRRGDAAGRRKDGEELGKVNRNTAQNHRGRRCGQTPAARIPCLGMPRTRPPKPPPPSLPFLSSPCRHPENWDSLTTALRRKSSFSSRASDGDGGRGSRSGDCGRGGPAAPGGVRPRPPPAPCSPRPRIGTGCCSPRPFLGLGSSPAPALSPGVPHLLPPPASFSSVPPQPAGCSPNSGPAFPPPTSPKGTLSTFLGAAD